MCAKVAPLWLTASPGRPGTGWLVSDHWTRSWYSPLRRNWAYPGFSTALWRTIDSLRGPVLLGCVSVRRSCRWARKARSGRPQIPRKPLRRCSWGRHQEHCSHGTLFLRASLGSSWSNKLSFAGSNQNVNAPCTWWWSNDSSAIQIIPLPLIIKNNYFFASISLMT